MLLSRPVSSGVSIAAASLDLPSLMSVYPKRTAAATSCGRATCTASKRQCAHSPCRLSCNRPAPGSCARPSCPAPRPEPSCLPRWRRQTGLPPTAPPQIGARFRQFRIDVQGLSIVVNRGVQIVALLGGNTLAQIVVRLVQGRRLAGLSPRRIQRQHEQQN